MKSLADRLEDMAVNGYHDSGILSETLRVDWLNPDQKRCVKRCLFGEEWRSDYASLLEISYAIRRMDE